MADGSPKTVIGLELGPAFEALYRQHEGMVRRALRQLGVPPGSLDDAVQDVFVVLYRRIGEYERDRSLKNWLWGIARGVASGYRRGARRRDRLHAALPAPEGPGLPERGVAHREAADILDEFLGSLDADKCAVFVMSELEGQRGPEIAERLGVNLNTVYARLRAARQRFDAAVAPHHEPARRPMLAAWLGWAWPAWLGKPAAAAAGVAAIAAVVVVGPGPSAPSREPTSGEGPREAEVVAMVPAHAAPAQARPSRPRLAVVEPEPQVLDEVEDELVLIDDEPAPARPPVPASPAAARREVTTMVAQPEAVPQPEAVAQPEPSLEAMPNDALQVPWSSLIEARRPVRHPSLLGVKQHFIAELLRIATRS